MMDPGHLAGLHDDIANFVTIFCDDRIEMFFDIDAPHVTSEPGGFGDQGQTFHQPYMSDPLLAGQAPKLFHRHPGSNLSHQRSATSGGIAHPETLHRPQFGDHAGKADRQGIENEAGIDSGSEYRCSGGPRQFRDVIGLLRVGEPGKQHVGDAPIDDVSDLVVDAVEATPGRMEHDIDFLLGEETIGVVADVDKAGFGAIHHQAEIPSDDRRIHIDGPDNLNSRPREGKSSDSSTDRAETVAHDTDPFRTTAGRSTHWRESVRMRLAMITFGYPSVCFLLA